MATKKYTVDGHCVTINGDSEKLVCDCSDDDMGKTEEQAVADAERIAKLLNQSEGA